MHNDFLVGGKLYYPNTPTFDPTTSRSSFVAIMDKIEALFSQHSMSVSQDLPVNIIGLSGVLKPRVNLKSFKKRKYIKYEASFKHTFSGIALSAYL